MPTLIDGPTTVAAVGNVPKRIDEYVGRVNSGTDGVSVAHMRSPKGWSEPGQRPEFDECTVVLKGALHVTHEDGTMIVAAGQAVIAHGGEWVQYGTPDEATDYRLLRSTLPGRAPVCSPSRTTSTPLTMT